MGKYLVLIGTARRKHLHVVTDEVAQKCDKQLNMFAQSPHMQKICGKKCAMHPPAASERLESKGDPNRCII